MRAALVVLAASLLAACPCDDDTCLSGLYVDWGAQIAPPFTVTIEIGPAVFTGTCPGPLTDNIGGVDSASCAEWGFQLNDRGFSTKGPYGDGPITGTVTIEPQSGEARTGTFISDDAPDDDACGCVQRYGTVAL